MVIYVNAPCFIMVHIHSSSWFRLYLTFERLARHGTCYGKPMSGPQHTSQCQCCRTASSWRPNRPRACGPMSFAASCPCLMNRLAPGIWLWLKWLASPESFRSCGSLMISDVGVCMYPIFRQTHLLRGEADLTRYPRFSDKSTYQWPF